MSQTGVPASSPMAVQAYGGVPSTKPRKGAAAMKKDAAVPVPAGERNWQAESDFRTLMDAHKIKSDKGRHAAAMGHAKKQLAAMSAMTAEPGESKAKEKGESATEKKAEKKAGID